jgi:hypothetical protein
MNKTLYTNIPSPKLPSGSSIQTFDAYYNQPLELSADVLAAMTGFFTSRGFEATAAESITVLIMKQAKKDGYNPMEILDTLKGLVDVEISALVAEIVNYNRFKTSALGYAMKFEPNTEVLRNIIA